MEKKVKKIVKSIACMIALASSSNAMETIGNNNEDYLAAVERMNEKRKQDRESSKKLTENLILIRKPGWDESSFSVKYLASTVTFNISFSEIPRDGREERFLTEDEVIIMNHSTHERPKFIPVPNSENPNLVYLMPEKTAEERATVDQLRIWKPNLEENDHLGDKKVKWERGEIDDFHAIKTSTGECFKFTPVKTPYNLLDQHVTISLPCKIPEGYVLGGAGQNYLFFTRHVETKPADIFVHIYAEADHQESVVKTFPYFVFIQSDVLIESLNGKTTVKLVGQQRVNIKETKRNTLPKPNLGSK
jgi:hypothetical protein